MTKYKASKNQIKYYNMEKSSNSLNMNFLYTITPDFLSRDLLQLLYNIIDKNEVFRTYIKVEDSIYYQYVKDIEKIIIKTQYYRGNNLDDIVKEINKYRFNLDYLDDNNNPLILFSIIDTNNQHYLHLLINHIAFDGYSEYLLLKDIFECPSKDKLMYINYTKELEQFENSDLFKSQLQYFKEYYKGVDTYFNYLPIDKKSCLFGDKHRGHIILTNNLNKIKTFCNKNRITLFSLCLSLFQLFICKHFNLEQTVVKTAIQNRNLNNINVLGCLVNTSYIVRNIKDRKLLELCKENLKDIFSFSDMSMVSSEYFKEFFTNKNVQKNYFMFSIFENVNYCKEILKENNWSVTYLNDPMVADLYIEIWEDRIDFTYNKEILKDKDINMIKDLFNNI
jgi:hypothetical protein